MSEYLHFHPNSIHTPANYGLYDEVHYVYDDVYVPFDVVGRCVSTSWSGRCMGDERTHVFISGGAGWTEQRN